MRIAVADDQPGVTDLYRRALTDLGHEVFVAGDGLQLVELCRRVRPDLIITDLEMPRLDGLAALQQVQQDKPIPAILVTAADFTRYDLPSWVRLVLSKPILVSELEEALRVFLPTTSEDTPMPVSPRTKPDGS